MSTPDDTRIPEDAALVAILSEQIGNLNTLVTRYRLRANAAEERAAAAEAEAESLRIELARARAGVGEPKITKLPRVAMPAAAAAPVGAGEINVTLDARPVTQPLAADVDELDELLGDVHLR